MYINDLDPSKFIWDFSWGMIKVNSYYAYKGKVERWHARAVIWGTRKRRSATADTKEAAITLVYLKVMVFFKNEAKTSLPS